MNSTLFRRLAIVMVLALALPAVRPGPAQANALTGEILVKFKPGTPGGALVDTHRQSGGVVKEVIPGIEVHLVAVPAGQEAHHVAAYLSNPYVLFAEVNGFYRVAAHGTKDPLAGQQWQYSNHGQTGGTVDADIDAFEAWHVTTGSKNVAIAILDTGIDQSHEDLSSKIVKNINFSTSLTVDDYFGHGTHVAGIAAAVTNNRIGVAGTCPKCVLYNVKVMDDTGLGSYAAIANGIVWAADNGAAVISMSLGGSGASSTLEAAVNYAWEKGAVLAGAAGNDGVSEPRYPGAYSNVIAVAATDHNDARWGYSNYGSWVDVAAPGDNVLSTVPDHPSVLGLDGEEKYIPYSGTSMATPHVAGIAGLVWASGLCSTNSCVRDRIETRADPSLGTGTSWTYGRANALNSVTP